MSVVGAGLVIEHETRPVPVTLLDGTTTTLYVRGVASVATRLAWNPCPQCGTSGDCVHCGGSGTRGRESCRMCNGSGNCQTCGGSGQVGE